MMDVMIKPVSPSGNRARDVGCRVTIPIGQPNHVDRSPIVIVAAARTPLGRFQGELAGLRAPALGARVIDAALQRANLAPDRIDEVLMGCVLPAGLGQAPARQAARGAGLPDAVGATTINKVCGSGMKATMLAHDLIAAGSAEFVLAGGMESMSNAPYLLAKARGGYRVGHDRVLDHMLLDGLEDAYEQGRSMGDFGEATAQAYQLGRAEQDAYAIETLTRARTAVEGGAFQAEIVPIAVPAKGGERLVEHDENPLKVSPEKIPNPPARLPARRHDHRRQLVDQCRWCRRPRLDPSSLAERDGLPILAEIKAHATHSQDPPGSRPHPSRRSANFWTRSAGRPPMSICSRSTRPSPWSRGGAARSRPPARADQHPWRCCALGHPIGATGARLIVTLLHALAREGLTRGVASLCIGGGEATAIAIERVH